MIKKLALALYLAGLVFLALNYQQVIDWWFLRTYTPTSQIAELARSTTMSDSGRRIFYATNPGLNDKAAFNKNCPVTEETLVLGCYSQRRIYILEVTQKQLKDVMDVTAAHEMLHAAYDRLSKKERESVDKQIGEVYSRLNDPKLTSLINNYPEDVRLNELHSVLGTQIVKLTPDLEAYYGRYFKDRQTVVKLYLEYEEVFEDIKTRTDRLGAQVEVIRGQLDALEVRINQKKAEIESLNAQMQSLRAQGNVDGYNALVPRQNQAVREYNALVAQYRDLVTVHNQKVAQLNRLVLLQNDLVDSLDSRKFDEL